LNRAAQPVSKPTRIHHLLWSIRSNNKTSTVPTTVNAPYTCKDVEEWA
jgi:hypothetical protein